MAHGEVEAVHHEEAEAQGRPEKAERPLMARGHRVEGASDARVDRQEALAVGRVATSVVGEFVRDDRRRLVAAHQGEVGQRHVEDAALEARAAGLQHGRAGGDEEALGEADDQGFGPEGAHALGEPLGEAPQARRLGGRDPPAEDRQRVGLEGVEGAAQAEERAARREERGADRDDGDSRKLEGTAAEAALHEDPRLEGHDGDEARSRRQDLERERGGEQPADQGEAPHQRVPRTPSQPSEPGAGEQHEQGEGGGDPAAHHRDRRQETAPVHQRGEGGRLVPGFARLHHGVGTAEALTVVTELQAEIGASVPRRARFQVRHDPRETLMLGSEGHPVVGAALALPDAHQKDRERQQHGSGDEAGKRTGTRGRARRYRLGNGGLLKL